MTTLRDQYYRVQPYHFTTSCPSLGTPAPYELAIENSSAQWGRVTYYDSHTDEIDEGHFCTPPTEFSLFSGKKYTECPPEYDEGFGCPNVQRQYEIAHGMYSAYAFCAEKDGKAVAICIQQMTDDEAMAKSIFESFHWTN